MVMELIPISVNVHDWEIPREDYEGITIILQLIVNHRVN